MVFWIKAVEKYQSVRTEAWNIIFYGCRASVINEKIVTLSHFFLSNECVEITTLFWTTMWRNYPYNNTMIIILQTTTYFRIQRMEQNIRRRMVWLFENTLCYTLQALEQWFWFGVYKNESYFECYEKTIVTALEFIVV